MNDNTPAPESYNNLPKFLVLSEDSNGKPIYGSDDHASVNDLTHATARGKTGVFVAVYQRVLMVRKST